MGVPGRMIADERRAAAKRAREDLTLHPIALPRSGSAPGGRAYYDTKIAAWQSHNRSCHTAAAAAGT
jgi:hypothetical protein